MKPLDSRLLENLSTICSSHSCILIVGDFNVNIDSQLQFPLNDFADTFSLDQIVDGHTQSRILAGQLQSSQLYLVYTNVTGLTVSKEFNCQSDHVILIIKSQRANIPVTKQSVSYLDWRKYDVYRARQMFADHLVNVDLRNRDPDIIYERITTALCLTLDQLVPKRTSNVRGKCPVINATIANLRNKKSRYYKKWSLNKNEVNFESLKKVSRELNKQIIIEKKKRTSVMLQGDGKKYWEAKNELPGKRVSHSNKLMNSDGGILNTDY